MERPTYSEILCKTALNRVRDMPFKWSLNPYRGCAHACHYCYARSSHAYLGLNADDDFEMRIFIKTNIAEVLRQELARPSWRRESIALGTATDCYQPAEGRFRLTRQVLEALLEYENPLGIVTKSTLILRDKNLLAELARRADVRVFFTVTTVDTGVWKMLEPGTPPPAQRLGVMRALCEAGINAGVIMAPILPGLTDSVEAIDAVMTAAEEHGATFFVGSSPVRLGPLVKEHFFEYIGGLSPELWARYQRAYQGAYAPKDYTERLAERVATLHNRHRFGTNGVHARPSVQENSPHAGVRTQQLSLPGMDAREVSRYG